jgi:glycosyltransferase involved in cell wall biosynthesis
VAKNEAITLGFEREMTTLIFHDYFEIRGGGERLVLELASGLSASICFAYRTDNTYPPNLFPNIVHDMGLLPLKRYTGRLLMLALPIFFSFQRRKAARYEMRIYSGVAAPFAAPASSAGGLNIFYCHTPPRDVYDQRAGLEAQIPFLLRWLAVPVIWLFDRSYRRALRRMDIVVTNSENTKRRIKHYLDCDSVVVHPPIEVSRFRYAGDGGYYLSTARLTALKRVDAIVTAFKAMPEKQLVVMSGGEDLERLRALAEGAANISFTGWINDDQLTDLVCNATATIYLPIDEDFGMSPVESMAAGKPVIGVAEGGLLETIVDDETGILLPPDFGTDAIVDAVHRMTPERAASMRRACEKRAALFSRDKFLDGMRQVIADVSQKEP